MDGQSAELILSGLEEGDQTLAEFGLKALYQPLQLPSKTKKRDITVNNKKDARITTTTYAGVAQRSLE